MQLSWYRRPLRMHKALGFDHQYHISVMAASGRDPSTQDRDSGGAEVQGYPQLVAVWRVTRVTGKTLYLNQNKQKTKGTRGFQGQLGHPGK